MQKKKQKQKQANKKKLCQQEAISSANDFLFVTKIFSTVTKLQRCRR